VTMIEYPVTGDDVDSDEIVEFLRDLADSIEQDEAPMVELKSEFDVERAEVAEAEVGIRYLVSDTELILSKRLFDDSSDGDVE